MDRESVKNLASLARIELTDKEEEKFANELVSVLSYVSQLQEVESGEDSSEVVPPNRFREDGEPHKSGEFTEDLLGEAPKRKDNFVSVKKIIENGKS